MTINLNKQVVTKDLLFKHVTDLEIFRFYSGEEVELKKIMSSPLREDKNPSFGYFVGESGELCFKDFVLGSGCCVKFVQLMFGLTWFEALSKIVIDFDLTWHFNYKEVSKTANVKQKHYDMTRDELLKSAQHFRLGKKKRNWEAHDLKYWYEYGVDKETLDKYNVEPIRYIFINGNPISADRHAYAYIETKDGKETYKIYQPFSKDYKWLNNHDESVWQGWSQLPEKGNELIITKSLKDVMAIDNILGIPAISLQAESVHPKNHIINELHSRFGTIYLLYDNDFDKEKNWGRMFGEKLASEFNFIQIEIPEIHKAKDFSDLVSLEGYDKAKKILEELVETPF